MMFDGTATTPGADGRLDDARASARAGKARYLLCADGYQLPFARRVVQPRAAHRGARAHAASRGGCWHEARRVLKPGGRVLIVVPNDVTMSVGRVLLLQVAAPLSGSPDVHDAGAHAALAARRLPDPRSVSRCRSARLPFAMNLYYFVDGRARLMRRDDRQASRRGARRRPGRHVGRVAAVGAGLSGDGARARRRRRRHGPDDHRRRPLRSSTSDRTRSTSARPTRAARSSTAIKPFFGEDPLILTRGTRVLLRGKEYVYPLELLQVLTGVSPLLSARIVFDYLMATLKTTLSPPKKEHSFEEWGVRNLGRTLYDLCFGIYSARVWGLPTGQISSKQAQRVAKLNLKNIILRVLGIKADPATYFTKYMYPRQGISLLFESMAAAVRKAGNCIRLESPVVRLERDGDRDRARRVYSRNGREQAHRLRRRAVDAAAAGAGRT